jgi:hypothetical protein
MPAPSTPTNLYVQQGNGQVYLEWDLTPGALTYSVQRSTDGVNFTQVGTPSVNNFLDRTTLVQVQYYYQVAAVNGSGTSAYTAAQTIVPVPVGQICLAEIRQEAQERSDQVNGKFLSETEWNRNITKSYKWLYNLVLQKFGEDYYYSIPCSYRTSGIIDPTTQAQTFPLPDGLTVTDAFNTVTVPGNTHSNTTIDGLANTNGIQAGMLVTGMGIPAQSYVVAGTITGTSFQMTQAATSTASSIAITIGLVVPAFQKLMLAEIALNPGDSNSWVTIRKYQRIQQNLWNFPNVYTFYGITNIRYRITGSNIQLVPLASSGQTFRIQYAPRPLTLMQDTDTVDGVAGFEELIIIDAAIKAMQKEESDCSVLMAQKAEMLEQIEAAAANRDVGEPECVSDSRTRNFAWSDDGQYGGGNGF